MVLELDVGRGRRCRWRVSREAQGYRGPRLGLGGAADHDSRFPCQDGNEEMND